MDAFDLFEDSRHAIRIPESISVDLPGPYAQLVDHPDFQRLRQVRQLGPIHLVYPGAMHTRFEHSLGVFWAAFAYLKGLLRRPQFRDQIEAADLDCLLTAALLHDIGHYPFAHSLEALHGRGFQTPRHEELAAELIQGTLSTSAGCPTLGEVIESEFGISRHRVASLVKLGCSPELTRRDQLLASIINSAIDADKFDYLKRDSIHMGVGYGRMPDLERLSANLTVNTRGDRVALTEKGRVVGEIFLFCRYLMFSEAYWHHTARSASAMIEAALGDYVERVKPTREGLIHLLLNHSDDRLVEAIARSGEAQSLSTCLLAGLTPQARRLYKRVLTLDRSRLQRHHLEAYETIYAMERRERHQLASRMRSRLSGLAGVELPEGSLLIDTPPRDKDQMDSVEVVYETPDSSEVFPLEQVSQVVRGIATDFVKVVKKIRIFVEPSLRSRLEGKQGAVEELLLTEILG